MNSLWQTVGIMAGDNMIVATLKTWHFIALTVSHDFKPTKMHLKFMLLISPLSFNTLRFSNYQCMLSTFNISSHFRSSPRHYKWGLFISVLRSQYFPLFPIYHQWYCSSNGSHKWPYVLCMLDLYAQITLENILGPSSHKFPTELNIQSIDCWWSQRVYLMENQFKSTWANKNLEPFLPIIIG